MNFVGSKLIYPQVETADLVSRMTSRCLSRLFLAAGTVRNSGYDSGVLKQHVLPGTVISVGNIAVGGTGKTPTVLAVLSHLQNLKQRPAVLTRGYGSGIARNQWILISGGELSGGNCRPQNLPDEARLQSVEFPDVPVIAGPNRFAGASAYLRSIPASEYPTHWILDDGFQHRSIRRDFNVVLLDRLNPFGNQSVLPFGMLREPLSALSRSDHILFTGNGQVADRTLDLLRQYAPGIAISYAESESLPLDKDISMNVSFLNYREGPLLLVAGIARPERLHHDLEESGVNCGAEWILPDHGQVGSDELHRRVAGIAAVVTTTKDYWRNPGVFHSLKIPVFLKKTRIVLPQSILTCIS